MCHTPHHATTKAIPPFANSGGKTLGLESSKRPNAEFWIPVSRVTERLSLTDIFPAVEATYPIKRAIRLWNSTIINTYLIYFVNNCRLSATNIETIATKHAIERYLINTFSLVESAGAYLVVRSPSNTGIPIIPTTAINSCSVGIVSVRNTELADDAKYLTYKPPHIAKLRGVNIGAANVVIVVIVTDNSGFPFACEAIKFETAPPGHDATIKRPMATIGVRIFLVSRTSRKVATGNINH